MHNPLTLSCMLCNLALLPPDNLESDSVGILIFTKALSIETSSCSEFFRRKASTPVGIREGEPFEDALSSRVGLPFPVLPKMMTFLGPSMS
jgi:hypothetical protein